MGDDQAPELYHGELDKWLEALETVLAAIRAWKPEESMAQETAANGGNPPELSNLLLEKLADDLELGDMNAIDQELKTIREYLDQDTRLELEQKIDNYDYEEAALILRQIKTTEYSDP